jgi:hypothetical protein
LSAIPIEGTFGSNLNLSPNNQQWLRMTPGRYSQMVIQLTDQSYNLLTALDPNVLFVLNIRKSFIEK